MQGRKQDLHFFLKNSLKQETMKKEKSINIYAYGKINLSLDVLGTTDDGFHEVEMVMQGIWLHDDVHIRWRADEQPGNNTREARNKANNRDNDQNEKAANDRITLKSNLPYVPNDERNIAYKAAQLMMETFPEHRGSIRIDIKKRIPVAAGLAGGSGNGAAVVMGLAKLWGLDISLNGLMELGAKLGSDVPFSMMLQAACNGVLGHKDDEMAVTCALAKGRGTELEPAVPLKSDLVLIKPALSVSTAEVYKGIDDCEITERPDNRQLLRAIREGDSKMLRKNMINVLENYTLHRYSRVNDLKNCTKSSTTDDEMVLMTGSGPTLFVLCENRNRAEQLAEQVREKGRQVIVTRTLI